MIPKSYFERNQDISPYAQRLWWCISTDSSEMVDLTQQFVLNDTFFPHPVGIIAYEIDEIYKETKYVTIIKRFHKPVSCLQVYDDWICKLYTTKRQGIDLFHIWHPSQSEISKRTINDNSFPDGFEGRRNKLWSFVDAIYRCFTDDDGAALQLR
jgi:hypothetical protein